MLKHTPLWDWHKAHQATLIDFAGWEMPLHYGSQITEHLSVRQDAGLFDVSHMGIIDIQGKDAAKFLRYVLANNLDKLKNPGRAFYTCMLNNTGGVVDDLIVYFISPEYYRLVVNASTQEKDLDWLKTQASQGSFNVHLQLEKNLAIIAVQGPNARQKAAKVLPQFASQILQLKPFQFFTDPENTDPNLKPIQWLIARTGYTGEDGIEMILPAELAEQTWENLYQATIAPAGLGARDTLRLEAGLNLYGQDMDEDQNPFESNLAWTVAMEPSDRNFIGRAAIMNLLQKGVSQKLVGLVLLDKGVLRHDQTVFSEGQALGKVTSGSFSPILKQSIGFARIPVHLYEESHRDIRINIRGKLLKAQIVQPPFVRRST